MPKLHCPACGKQYDGRNALMAHLNATEAKGFVCKERDKGSQVFVSEGLSGPFDCCRKLKTANLLIMHMKSKHGVTKVMDNKAFLEIVVANAEGNDRHARKVVGRWALPKQELVQKDNMIGIEPISDISMLFDQDEDQDVDDDRDMYDEQERDQDEAHDATDGHIGRQSGLVRGEGNQTAQMLTEDEDTYNDMFASGDDGSQRSYSPDGQDWNGGALNGDYQDVDGLDPMDVDEWDSMGAGERGASDMGGPDTSDVGELYESDDDDTHPETSAQHGEGERDVEGLEPEADEGLKELEQTEEPPVEGYHQPSPLQQWGLAINKDLGILICLTCKYALIPESKKIHVHLKNKHKMKQMDHPTLQEDLQNCLDPFEFTPVKEARNQPWDQAPIPGITVQGGFYCPFKLPDGSHCTYVAGRESTLKQHFKMHHRGSDIPKRSALKQYSCDIQTVFIAGDRKYFRVQTGLADMKDMNPYTVFVEAVGPTLPSYTEPEIAKDAELPSFLRRTGWHVFMAPHRKNPKDVVALLQYPTASKASKKRHVPSEEERMEEILRVLSTVSESWIKEVHEYWYKASDYILRILANYPMNNERWTWVESSEDSYVRTLVRFVAAGIRSVNRDQARCRLPLTEDLEVKARELYEALARFDRRVEASERAKALEGLVHLFQDFFFRCVTEMVKEAEDEKFKCPVQVFMACFAYNEDDTFKTPSEVTSVLAQWQYLLRCTALHHAATLAKKDETVSAIGILLRHCPVHLTEGHFSVFDDIRQLQHLASSLAHNQTLVATTAWSPGLTDVHYLRFTVNIARLVQGVQEMLKDLNSKMYRLSGGKPITCVVPQKHVDDLGSMARGQSWMQASHTEPREQALMHAMVKQGTWTLNAVNRKGGLTWNKVACREFMRTVGGIVDLMVTLVHIGSGPPVRGEEIVRDQITNGLQPRSLYLAFGRFILVRRHSKDTNARGMDPFNVRYLPQNLTEAISYYLLVIRPLERLVAQHLYEDQIAVQHYDLYLHVKEGKRITSKHLSEVILEKLTKQYIGVGLTLGPLRHIMIAFQREYVPESRVQKGNNIGDLLSSHTSPTADWRYAIEQGTLEGHTVNYLLDVQDWCELYHDAIGLGERVGPLIPNRIKRKLARQLDSIVSTAIPAGVSMANTSATILKELGDTVFRSVVDELKPYLSAEVGKAVNMAVEYLMQAMQRSPSMAPRDLAVPGRPEDASSRDTPISEPSDDMPVRSPSPQEPPTAQLPERSRSPPRPARTIPQLEGVGPRPTAKRDLSQRFEPVAKRRPVHTSYERINDLPTAQQPLSAVPTAVSVMGPNDFADVDLDKELEDYGLDEAPPSEVSGGSLGAAHSSTRHLPQKGTVPANQGDATTTKTLSPMHMGKQGIETSTTSVSRRITFPHPLPTVSDANIKQALSRLLRDEQACFKSDKQFRLVRSVVAGEHTIAVLPTGAGKSMAYEVPTLCNSRITIAAFPFRILVSQAQEKCEARGLPVERWTSKGARAQNKAKLVVMAIETLLSSTMMKWIHTNHTSVGAIVVDEIHAIVNNADFRKAMRNIRNLMSLKVPITFLTATLPTRLDQWYIEYLGLPKKHTKIRADTDRPEHRYILFTTAREDLSIHTVAFILESSRALSGSQRAIVFVRSKQFGQYLKSVFPQMGFISSDIEDEAERSTIIDEWKDGKSGGWIIGTSSLIQGVDYHDVCLVVFAASPFGMVDFVQGAGRAGRNGRESKVVMLHDGTIIPPVNGDADDLTCRREMIKWLANKTQCRRLIISECMDGKQTTCRSLESATPCDICERSHNLIPVWDAARLVDPDDLYQRSDILQPDLTSSTSEASTLEPTTRLPAIPLRPRLAPPDILRTSMDELTGAQLRLQKAMECIDALETFGQNCGICHAQSAGDVFTNKKHPTWKSCINVSNVFHPFYDWNKPKNNNWWYDSSIGHWCWFCAIPHAALRERGRDHMSTECPWSDTITGVAWSVWHNSELFTEMKQTLNCPVPLGTRGSDDNARLSWCKWLAERNEAKNAYNIHALWLWFRNRKQLAPGSGSQAFSRGAA